MPIIRRTPTLYASGKYTVSAPFALEIDTVYTTIAIRSFADIVAAGEEVFTTYYEPFALTENIFTGDLAAKVSIVTLRAEDGTLFYIPDSYILSYPDISNIQYSHIVLSLDYGGLPNIISLDFLIQQLKTTSLESIGIDPSILIHKVPTTEYVSALDNASAEAARVANITNHISDAQTVRELQRTINEQQVVINQLTQMAIDNNLIDVV